MLEGFGHDAVTLPAVDVSQHAAEKVHAYARIYAHDRPSSRVKDLVDLALFAQAGLLGAKAWGARIWHVFEVRDGADPPIELPPPPGSWSEPYAQLAAELGLVPGAAEAAWRDVNAAYIQARGAGVEGS